MNSLIKKSALIKLARYGSGVLIALGGGKYLLEENTEEPNKGALRPVGGGAQKGDWNLDETIVRELGEELGLEADAILDRLHLAGYIPNGKFRGCAMYILERTPEMERAGLTAGTYQATNSKDEKVKLVEATLDDDRYIADKPHQLLSTQPASTPGKFEGCGPEGVRSILYAPELPEEEHGPGYCPRCYAYSPPGTVAVRDGAHPMTTCGLCGHKSASSSWSHDPATLEKEAGTLAAPTRPATPPPSSQSTTAETPFRGRQLGTFDAASIPRRIYGGRFPSELAKMREYVESTGQTHWSGMHDRMEQGFRVPVYDSLPRHRVDPKDHWMNTVGWPEYHPPSQTMAIVPEDSEHRHPEYATPVSQQLEHEGGHALLEDDAIQQAFPNRTQFVDPELNYTERWGLREEILLGLRALQGDLFTTRGSRLESPEAATQWMNTVLGLDDKRFDRLTQPYSHDGREFINFLRRYSKDRPEKVRELIEMYAPSIPALASRMLGGGGDAAKTAAVGIPDRTDLGEVDKLPTARRIAFIRQKHLAERAGEHADIRMGTPETGLFSWAMRHPLPKPGEKRMAFRQPIHDYDYKSFQGEIPEGYGKGTVTLEEEDEVVLTRAEPDRISFYTTHKKRPEFFTMIRQSGDGKNDPWLVVNTTPTDPAKVLDGDASAFSKVRFKSVPADQVEQFFEDHVVEAKIDGASALFKMGDHGIEALSYRIGRDGSPIIHTQRFFGEESGKTDVPAELKGLVFRGEIFGDDGRNGVLPPQQLSGILNSSVANALDTQRSKRITLKAALYDVVGQQDATPEERRKTLQKLVDFWPEKFLLPEAATTPDGARRLWEDIAAGQHPQTREGIVAYPRKGGVPTKVKLRPEWEVYIRDIFPGTGKYADAAGGFAYSMDPDGPVVGRVGTGFDDEMRRAMKQHPEDYTGRYARVTAPSQTESGALFQPAFVALHEDYPTTSVKRSSEEAPTAPTRIKSARERIQDDAITGPEAIRRVLMATDMDEVEKDARSALASGRTTQRRAAVEKLRILQGLRRNKRTPEDLMITRVPVIPAAFRPFSFAGDTFVPGDANELYQDLIKLRDTYESLKDVVGEEAVQDLNLNLYDGVKAVYGYGDAVLPKTRQRGVSGFLQQLVGGGPKQSFVQRKMLSKPQDFVGRAVITPDPDLGLDEIAIPEELAWTTYSPHIQRRLVRKGYPKTDAVRLIRDRAPAARRELLEETKVRPVMYSRAPAWHKFSVLGGWPKLTDSSTIQVNPFVTTGLGADFNGDDQIGKVLVLLPLEFKLKNQDLYLTSQVCESMVQSMFKNTVIPTFDTKNYSLHLVDLEDFPHGELDRTNPHGKNGPIHFYHVPRGIKAVAFDETNQTPVWADVAFYSIHPDRYVELVDLSNDRQITTDDDPRAVYGVDPAASGFSFGRFSPTDALSREVVVPCVRDVEPACHNLGSVTHIDITTQEGDVVRTQSLDWDFGYVLGALAGDGWWDKYAYRHRWGIHLSDNKGFNAERVFTILSTIFSNVYRESTVATKTATNGRYGDSVRHSFYFDESEAFCFFLKRWLKGGRNAKTSGSGNKVLPDFFVTAPREFREGLLNGIMDSDGSVSISHAKRSPQLLCAVTSTSLRLINDVKFLCLTLGINATVAFSKTTVRDNMSWICTLSTVDAKKMDIFSNLACPWKRDAFVKTAVSSTGGRTGTYNAVVLPADVADLILKEVGFIKITKAMHASGEDLSRVLAERNYYQAIWRGRSDRLITRFQARNVLKFLEDKHAAAVADFNSLVEFLEGIQSRVPISASDVARIRKAIKLAAPIRAPSELYDSGNRVYAATNRVLKEGFITERVARNFLKFLRAYGAYPSCLDSEEIQVWKSIVENDAIVWARVKAVHKTGIKEDGYDLTVPGYETFMNAEGVILSNTVNIHTPATDETVREVRERLMPSRMILSERNPDKVMNPPKHEMVLGLYAAKNRPARTLHDGTDMDAIMAGIESGDISLQDEIILPGEEAPAPTIPPP